MIRKVEARPHGAVSGLSPRRQATYLRLARNARRRWYSAVACCFTLYGTVGAITVAVQRPAVPWYLWGAAMFLVLLVGVVSSAWLLGWLNRPRARPPPANDLPALRVPGGSAPAARDAAGVPGGPRLDLR